MTKEKLCKWVVCFAPGDYHQFTPSCTTYIMHAFWEAGYKILWINPMPVGIPTLRNHGGWQRIFRRLRSYSRPFRRVRSGFYTFSPVAWPARGGGRGNGWNESIISFQIKCIEKLIRVYNPLIWFETPAARFALDFFLGVKVYQLSDKYELSRYASAETKKNMAGNSHDLINKCDLVICCGRKLWREVQVQRPDAIYLPHAVQVSQYTKIEKGPPDDIKNLPHPIIGYFGTLSGSNDQSILIECAKRHPEWSIVLIGRITGGDWAELMKFSNVHFLGFKPLEEIPQYGQCFDVGIMNWFLDEWIRYSHPLKLREYLALGLPVVSVPIPEVVESYADFVYLADTPGKFVVQVERALKENTPEKKLHRLKWVSNFSWENYVEIIQKNIQHKNIQHKNILEQFKNYCTFVR
ncbi:MAG: glycosyltransferase [Phycisphaerae bacterium]